MDPKHDVVDTMDEAEDTELVPARVLYWMNQEDDEAMACVPEPGSPLYHAWATSRDE